jgi:hypothetical protein
LIIYDCILWEKRVVRAHLAMAKEDKICIRAITEFAYSFNSFPVNIIVRTAVYGIACMHAAVYTKSHAAAASLRL